MSTICADPSSNSEAKHLAEAASPRRLLEAAPPLIPAGTPGPYLCPQCHKSCDTRKTLKLHLSRAHKINTPSHPFDRALHSVGGMPTCAMCHHQFTRWEVLAKHVSSWSCPAMPLPPTHTCAQAPSQGLPQADDPPGAAMASDPLLAPDPSAPTPPPAGHQMPRTAATSELVSTDIRSGHSVLNAQVTLQPDSLWARAMNILTEGGLPALLRHQINQELLHHCGICEQWLDDAHCFEKSLSLDACFDP